MGTEYRIGNRGEVEVSESWGVESYEGKGGGRERKNGVGHLL